MNVQARGVAPELRELTLPQRLFHWARVRADEVALRQKDMGIWKPVTWSGYAMEAASFGLGLIELGLKRGEHVAILSENRKEWVFVQMGVGLVQGVPAGVYPTSPGPEVQYLLTLCEAPYIVCEDQEQLDKVLEVRDLLPQLRQIIVIDPKGLRHYDRTGILEFTEVTALGKKLADKQPDVIAQYLERQRMDDTGLVVFTSGSTGRPKAAMLSWRGLCRAGEGLNGVLHATPNDKIVSYLPLCHMAEQMFAVQVPLTTGAVVNFAESIRTVQEDLREVAPQIFLAVPRIWEKFHSSIEIRMREAGGLRQSIYRAAMDDLGRYAHVARQRWSLAQRLRGWMWHWLVLRALLNYVGLRECRIAVSGSAPISPDILKFFKTLGLSVREAYGLTEASGASSLQPSDESPVGSVGAPFPGIEMKLAEDGELLLRGDVVFKGYYNGDAATAQAIDDQGWLHTGDVARLEPGPLGEELRIIDRKKDIMITAGGKNITPTELENALRFSAYIKEAIIIADRRRFVAALIQIDPESVGKWAEESGIAYTNYKSLAELAQVRALVQQEIDAMNAKMPQVQHVRKFHLLTKELDHDDGEVTATMKVKRSSIEQKYSDAIEAMYA
ncbi:long-chain fatty acid--CoA ligase [Caenimonas sp. SL110]|uniref:AMP-dependent synthetase/ligase n=1 Tax=Caenimonas sp. SL110 TaxID=1450524 RepID=UPI000653F974|nr:AMP-binding protein [Caenimonas sp. SL110]